MFATAVVCLLVGFTLGNAYREAIHEAKKRRRYERRNKILKLKDNIVDEVCRWETEHPKILKLTSPKGVTIFKGGIDAMSQKEFRDALKLRKKHRACYERR